MPSGSRVSSMGWRTALGSFLASPFARLTPPALLQHQFPGRIAHAQQRPTGGVAVERQRVVARRDRRWVQVLELTAGVGLQVRCPAGIEGELRARAGQRAVLLPFAGADAVAAEVDLQHVPSVLVAAVGMEEERDAQRTVVARDRAELADEVRRHVGQGRVPAAAEFLWDHHALRRRRAGSRIRRFAATAIATAATAATTEQREN